jgi:hypothetical protein
MKRYKSIIKEAEFSKGNIQAIIAAFKECGFKVEGKEGEQKEGIFYASFEKGKEILSIEDAIENLQALKKNDRKNTGYRFEIV